MSQSTTPTPTVVAELRRTRTIVSLCRVALEAVRPRRVENVNGQQIDWADWAEYEFERAWAGRAVMLALKDRHAAAAACRAAGYRCTDSQGPGPV